METDHSFETIPVINHSTPVLLICGFIVVMTIL